MNALALKGIFLIALQIKMQPINNYLYVATLEKKKSIKKKKALNSDEHFGISISFIELN